MSTIHPISTLEVYQRQQSQAQLHLIDVRTPEEFNQIHAQGALHLPLDKISGEQLKSQGIDLQEPVYLICQSGKRSYRACEILIQAGFVTVYNVTGGTMDWADRGLPTHQK